jgi:hypothetical protein
MGYYITLDFDPILVPTWRDAVETLVALGAVERTEAGEEYGDLNNKELLQQSSEDQ